MSLNIKKVGLKISRYLLSLPNRKKPPVKEPVLSQSNKTENKALEEKRGSAPSSKDLITIAPKALYNPMDDPMLKTLVPFFIEKVGSAEELAAWGKEIKGLIFDYSEQWNDFPHEYAKSCLPELLKQVNSLDELKNWDGELKALIADYSEQFGNIYPYVGFCLPVLLTRFKSLNELKNWDRELKALIAGYSKQFKEVSPYAKSCLPELLKQVNSLDELKNWDGELKALIADYYERSGDPFEYADNCLPELLKQIKSLEELKIWDKELKALIADYYERSGDPYPHCYVGIYLPELLKQVKSLKELRTWDKELKALIATCYKQSGPAPNYVPLFHRLIKQVAASSEELKQISKIGQNLFSAKVKPSPLGDILERTTDRSVIYNHEDQFIRFCKNSSSNLPNNLAFFQKLSTDNAKNLYAESLHYFQSMQTSLFLPKLFDEFLTRDGERRSRLANDFRKYYSAQVFGKQIASPELSTEIIEEINYSLVGSTSLTLERFRETLTRAKGKKIPTPNFTQTISFKLRQVKKEGCIQGKDIPFIKERISFLEQALDLLKETKDIAAAIQAFPATDRPGKKPSAEHTMLYLKLHLLKSYHENPVLKDKIDALISKKENFSSTDLEIPEGLIEIFKEIKPDAEQAVRQRIDGAVDVPRLEKIVGRFKKERSANEIAIALVPAKTELDSFYGYMGENCTSGYPGELFNPSFTPLRIVVNGKIKGSIHTLTLNINGKKTLVICGIEPKESLLSEIDAKEFTLAVMEKIKEEICQPNGYARLCLTTSNSSQSNRPTVASCIQSLIKDKPKITQDVQSTFPEGSPYSIAQLVVID